MKSQIHRNPSKKIQYPFRHLASFVDFDDDHADGYDDDYYFDVFYYGYDVGDDENRHPQNFD